MSFLMKPAFFVVCLAVALATLAQSQAPQQSELVLRSTTRMVSVDAIVLGRDGRPVTDLTRDDFTILEDGRPQAIATFSVSDPPLTAQRQGARPQLPRHVTSNRPDVIGGTDRIAVLLLDGLNTTPQNQTYLKQQMLKFVAEHFDPGRKLAVLALTEKLVVLQDFTSNPALLKTALERYKATSPAAARNGGEYDLSSTYVATPGISL